MSDKQFPKSRSSRSISPSSVTPMTSRTTTGFTTPRPGRHPMQGNAALRATGTRRCARGRHRRSLFAEEERDDLPLVNLLREDVRRWREADYRAR